MNDEIFAEVVENAVTEYHKDFLNGLLDGEVAEVQVPIGNINKKFQMEVPMEMVNSSNEELVDYFIENFQRYADKLKTLVDRKLLGSEFSADDLQALNQIQHNLWKNKGISFKIGVICNPPPKLLLKGYVKQLEFATEEDMITFGIGKGTITYHLYEQMRKRGITIEDARKYIVDAYIMFRQNGKESDLYVSKDGSTVTRLDILGSRKDKDDNIRRKALITAWTMADMPFTHRDSRGLKEYKRNLLKVLREVLKWIEQNKSA